MGDWHIVKPEATTILNLDPIFEDGLTNYLVSSSPAAASVLTTTCFVGKKCIQIDALAGSTGFEDCSVYQSLGSLSGTLTLQAMIRRAAGGVLTNTQAQALFGSSTNGTNWDSVTHVRDGWYLCKYTATAPALSFFGVDANEVGLLIGAMWLEEKAYGTTLAYGSKTPNIPKGYYWSSTPYASTSVRDSQERSGGKVVALSDYMNVQKVTGWGVPDPNVSRDKPAQLDGTIYNSTLYSERVMQFTGIIIPTAPDLKAFPKRSPLVDLLRRDLVVPQQPFILRYTGGDDILEAEFFYEGGLDGLFDANMGNNDKVSFRLFSNDPFWYALGNDAATLDIQDTLTTNYVIQRSRVGAWSNLATTLNGAVRALAKDSSNNLWLGGDMTAPGTGAVKWNGSSLSAVSGLSAAIYALCASGTDVYAGGANNSVAKSAAGGAFSALTVDLGANGPIYAVHTDGTTVWVGGEFTQIGGIAANNIAALTISGATWAAMGSGTNGPVYAIHKNGTNVFVGGAFTLAGGVAGTNRIARWATGGGGSWNAMGTGVTATSGSDGHVYDIDSDSSNNIYAVGGFSQMGGVSNTIRISKWNGSAWSALSTGLGTRGTAYTLEVDASNNIYVGGIALLLGTTFYSVVKWNGSAWSGIGESDTVYTLYHDGTDLYAGGLFPLMSSVADTARLAKHNGTVWSPLSTGVDNGIVYAIVPRGTSFIICGSFLNGGGVAAGDYVVRWTGAAFAAMASGFTGGIARAMGTVGGASDDVYIGGEFHGGAEGDYLTNWDGSSFTEEGAGSGALSTNAAVYALAKIGNILYLGGLFTTANSLTVNYVYSLDLSQSNLGALLSTGMNEAVYVMLASSAGILYLGGAFTAAAGTTVNYVCSFNPATGTFSALGSGLSGVVRALAFDKAGRLWAAGESGLLAYYNGSVWTVIDTGTTATLYALAFDDDGNAYIGGAFEEIGGYIADGIVLYDGSGFKLVDIDLPSAATAYTVLNDANELTFGFNTAGVTTTPGTTAVTNNGKALSFPIIEFTGPGTLREISNTTIKKNIYFNNLELATGEIVTLDLSPFAKTLISNTRGDISGRIIQSDEDTFALLAGANSIKTFITNASASAVMTWRLAYEDVSGPSA